MLILYFLTAKNLKLPEANKQVTVNISTLRHKCTIIQISG